MQHSVLIHRNTTKSKKSHTEHEKSSMNRVWGPHDMMTAEREPINGVRGQSPSGVQGHSIITLT